jgi:pimeloyl-ACP methyl ester carboxylesterase
LLSRLLTPWGALNELRDQFGSVRGVYLAGNRVARRDDFGDRDEIVLLLHGFFQTRNVFEVMEDRLRFDGYAVASFNLGGVLHRFNTHPVDRLAEIVAHKVEGLAERYGFERLHLVGHSKGGIIARRYVQHFGGDRRAKSVITLGTPHHGTPTAMAGVVLSKVLRSRTSATELLPRSPLVDRLALDPFPSEIPLTSIYSRADLVCPYWCSVLRPRPGERHLSNVEIPGVGHSALTWDPRVYKVVRGRIEEATTRWRERDTVAPDRASAGQR